MLIWFAAFHLGIVKRADQSIFGWFASMHHGAYAAANRVARLCDLKHYIFIAAIPVLIALARGRPLVAVAIATVLIGANVTTQLVKPVFAHPRPSMVLGGVLPSASSWPSGHATAAMSLALASVLAAPSRLRPLVAALGAIFAAAVSYALLTLRWHYASDVFGGFLVAGVWALLAAGSSLPSMRNVQSRCVLRSLRLSSHCSARSRWSPLSLSRDRTRCSSMR